jgi:hypothetical protein
LDGIILEITVFFFKELGGGDIQTNHDCYFVHPNDTELLLKANKKALKWFFRQDFLAQIAKQFGVKCPEFLDEVKVEDLTCNYSLC